METLETRARLVYFLHIPKTAGTSVCAAIKTAYPGHQVFSEPVSLTRELIEDLDRNHPHIRYVYGHPGFDILNADTERLETITFLRKPADQIVSNFLHVADDPANPLYWPARTLGFAEFCRQNWYFMVFQTGSIAASISREAPTRVKHLELQLGNIIDALERMSFVGVVDRMTESMAALSPICGVDRLSPPYLNSSVIRGVRQETIERLKSEYDSLRSEPDMAYLMSIEQVIYDKANSLLEQRLHRDAPNNAVVRPCDDVVLTLDASQFSSNVGSLVAGDYRAPLAGVDGHVIYGPYHRLPVGAYRADYLFRIDGAEETAQAEAGLGLEVVLNARTYLATKALPGPCQRSPGSASLDFVVEDPHGILEFRIHAKGYASGLLLFKGLRIARI